MQSDVKGEGESQLCVNQTSRMDCEYVCISEAIMLGWSCTFNNEVQQTRIRKARPWLADTPHHLKSNEAHYVNQECPDPVYQRLSDSWAT
jgi:hypothetical protein